LLCRPHESRAHAAEREAEHEQKCIELL